MSTDPKKVMAKLEKALTAGKSLRCELHTDEGTFEFAVYVSAVATREPYFIDLKSAGEITLGSRPQPSDPTDPHHH